MLDYSLIFPCYSQINHILSKLFLHNSYKPNKLLRQQIKSVSKLPMVAGALDMVSNEIDNLKNQLGLWELCSISSLCSILFFLCCFFYHNSLYNYSYLQFILSIKVSLKSTHFTFINAYIVCLNPDGKHLYFLPHILHLLPFVLYKANL